MTELETSIQGKTAAVEKLQEEILSMVVKKEMLSKQIEEVNSSHSEKHQALVEQANGNFISSIIRPCSQINFSIAAFVTRMFNYKFGRCGRKNKRICNYKESSC